MTVLVAIGWFVVWFKLTWDEILLYTKALAVTHLTHFWTLLCLRSFLLLQFLPLFTFSVLAPIIHHPKTRTQHLYQVGSRLPVTQGSCELSGGQDDSMFPISALGIYLDPTQWCNLSTNRCLIKLMTKCDFRGHHF